MSAPSSVLGRVEECPNCDDRRCMACVFREVHDRCEDDCPFCCSEQNEAREAAFVAGQKAAIRSALVDFLDWETVYESEGFGDADSAGAANRDYDRLTERIWQALSSAARAAR